MNYITAKIILLKPNGKLRIELSDNMHIELAKKYDVLVVLYDDFVLLNSV